MKTKDELYDHIHNLLDRMLILVEEMCEDNPDNEDTVVIDESEQSCSQNDMKN